MTGLSYPGLASCSLDTFAARLVRRDILRGRVARTGPGACREKGRLLQNYRGVLTADFHAAESRGLRHWFAALREGCGPGPTRHDPIPLILSGLWETVTC